MVAYSDTDPHALILLLGAEPGSPCLHVWRDEAPAAALQAGDLIPLPDEALEAAGGNIEPAGEVDRVFFHGELPGDVRAMLTDGPAEGCSCVIVLRVLAPEVTEDGFVPLGAFDPADAKPLLRLLEEHEVPFEVEADHSELLQPGRAVGLYLGMGPAGSCLRIFVHHEHLGHVHKLLRWLYLSEKPGTLPARRSGDPGSPGNPAMEIYSPPRSDLSWEVRRDFYIRTGGNFPGPAPDTDR